jgi:BASS family bile acid:Na+ symporter
VKTLRILAAVITGAILQNADQLGRSFGTVVPLTLAFSALSLTIGYWVPRLNRIERPQAIASSMEIGIHNGALAVTVALSPAMLNLPAAALPPAIYSLVSFTTAAVTVYLVTRLKRVPTAVATAPGS